MSGGSVLSWVDAELSGVGDTEDHVSVLLDGEPIGELVVYPSFPGAWQRIHGYSDDELLWSFDIDINDERHRNKGYGSRAVRHTCEAVLEMRRATRMVVDVRADSGTRARAAGRPACRS